MPKPIDAEIKARALADLMTGMSLRAVARKYSVDPTAILKWRDASETATKALSTQKAITLAGQVAEYLHVSLIALTNQARLFGDPEWLARQTAEDLAQLHGIHNDKVVRLLYAVRPAPEEPEQSDRGDIIDAEAG